MPVDGVNVEGGVQYAGGGRYSFPLLPCICPSLLSVFDSSPSQ